MATSARRMATKKRKTMADKADRHELYQEAVQNPEFELDFIDETFEELTGRTAYSMREDFCGTAISSTNWVTRRDANTAVAVDIDPEVLAWAQTHNVAALSADQRSRLVHLGTGRVQCNHQ